MLIVYLWIHTAISGIGEGVKVLSLFICENRKVGRKEGNLRSFITFDKGGMIMYLKGRFNKKATQTSDTSYCILCCTVKKMSQICGGERGKDKEQMSRNI